jgi:ABC-type iron transport system FetAB ATPase subunit
MPKVLAKKMKEKKLAVETKVLTDCESQFLYFSSKVKQIREGESRRQALIRNLRQMSSSFSWEYSGLSDSLLSSEGRLDVEQ